MAYRIVYGPAGPKRNRMPHVVRIQILTVLGMLCMLALISRFYRPGAELVGLWLTPGLVSPGQRAMEAMAEAWTAGEGWYHSAVVFCGTLLELTGQ